MMFKSVFTLFLAASCMAAAPAKKVAKPKCAEVSVIIPNAIATDSSGARTAFITKQGVYNPPEDLVKAGTRLKFIRVENYTDGIAVFGFRVMTPDGEDFISNSLQPGETFLIYLPPDKEEIGFYLISGDILVPSNGGVLVQYVYRKPGQWKEDPVQLKKEKPSRAA